MKAIIIGGVAAGASAAARLRRLDEAAEIVLIERGADISYANCGLPYHIGGVIADRRALSVMSAKGFRDRFNVDVRPLSEAIAIDRAARTLTIRGPQGEYVESYDRLVIATGSSPVRLNQPGSDDPRIVPLWTLTDMDAIMARLKEGVKRAIVIGAGFVGLEVAENLRARNLEVTVVELADQILPIYDREMVGPLAQELAGLGIGLKLGRKVVAFESDPSDAGQIVAILDNGEKLPAHLVVESVGVRPNSALAAAAGLALGPRGHIIVDAGLRTSDLNIFAAGDVIEVDDPILGGKTTVPLAGPANKQGRIVADNIAGGNSHYRGSYGASVIKIGRFAFAAVGANERRLKQQGTPYHKIYTHPASHAGYYPGSVQMHAKLLFARDGKILGAQCAGMDGADKRIDVIAAAMQQNLTAPELAWLELCYAPPFNSAKDPVNILGMIADNVLTGKADLVHADDLPKDAFLLDVRQPEEHARGALPDSLNIPLPQLRDRINELDKSRFIIIYCQSGLRGYLAERILKQSGYKAANLSGGYITWKSVWA